MFSKVIIMDGYTYKNERFSHHRIKNKRKFTGIHYHDEYELYYLINGETKYFIGDEIFSVKKDNFVFVPKGMFHKPTAKRVCTTSAFWFVLTILFLMTKTDIL